MKNIEKYKDIVLDNMNICDVDTLLRGKCTKEYRELCAGFNCTGCRERFLKWLLEEAKEPVLDDVEKSYLAGVIKPFRNKIDTISKLHSYNNIVYENNEYIYFSLKDNGGFSLPLFKQGKMYKGMQQGKHYKLNELGL